MDTIYSIMVENVKKIGNREFITYINDNGNIIQKNYKEYFQDVIGVTNYFRKKNIKRQKIALLAENSYEWMVCSIAIILSNNILVPLDHRLLKEQISETILFSEVTHILYSIDYYPKIENFKSKIQISTINTENNEDIDIETNQNDLCLIMFTSGSTGISKGVMLTQKNLISNLKSLYTRSEFSENYIVLGILPMFHIFSFSLDILWCILFGKCLVLNNRFEELMNNIKKFRVFRVCLVPVIAERILNDLSNFYNQNPNISRENVKYKLLGPNFKRICIGGAYINPKLKKEFLLFGIEVVCGYGMTETAGVVSSDEGVENRIGSVGAILSCNNVKIVNNEILIKGSNVSEGYFKNEEDFVKSHNGEWLCTGDLGYIDQNNYLYVIGKKKNLIITNNGENVSAEELEKMFYNYEGIKELIVYQKDNTIAVEIFPDMIFFATKKKLEMNRYFAKIIHQINKRNPGYMHIHSFSLRDKEFEKTSTMKIKRDDYYYK